MNDHIPENWKLTQLKEIASIVSGGTPSREIFEFWGKDIPWVTPTDITKTKGRFLFDTAEGLSTLGLSSSSASILPTGTILMTSRATVGDVRIAAQEVCTNQGFKSLVPHKGIDNLFLFYQLQRCREAYKVFGIGSTFIEVNKKDTERFELILPQNLKEQKSISKVLNCVDNAIETTEILIHKYQQIKAGLMHDLFTRGVTADGKLRPPREQAPELYKETPIGFGWIPKEWEFTTCSQVCDKIIDCKNRTPMITPDGYPVIRTPNVRNGKFVDDELVFTNLQSYKIWTMRGEPNVGDIVITREAPVGEVCMIPERHPNACLGQRMMLYRPDNNVIDANFFLFALQSQVIQKRLDLISGGSTVGHVRVGDIRDLFMFKPKSFHEQKKIGSLLSSIERKIDTENLMQEKLKKQKSGLMEDLLTGKVQVKTNQEEPCHV